MLPLNLPLAEMTLRSSASFPTRREVLDPLRQRWVALTPEEYVRQSFVAWIISAKGYRATRMANEMAITLNGLSRRCDTVVFHPDGRRPMAIIEYKAPTVKISSEVFAQAARYNIALSTPLLIVSNGLTHYCALTSPGEPPRFLPDIPTYEELTLLVTSTHHSI
ncbi:MAG: type I restriction enzyme HsdR N-terminal domain-containing protein [Pseudoflavonifractor sp.]|nr:type I restriction enzyme HsdR N-terminal domain-containing protein [Alloprevotella sp.]MCM1117666.1 type I restriction enzyme HsdR N-terminal domain-containing protein [Pseudoflavonifractor sp.]